MAHQVTDATFDADVLKSPIPVLVDFWAPWCGPCRAMGPMMEELSSEYEGKVKVAKVNVDENPEYSGQYGVMSIPNFIIFKGGQPVEQFVGTKSKEEMKAKLDAVA